MKTYSFFLFSDESAGDPVHLTAKIYNDTVSCYPVRIALCDTLLFAVNSGSAGDPLVTCFNVSDARYRGLGERCRMINLRDTLVLGKMNPVWLKESYAATSLFLLMFS